MTRVLSCIQPTGDVHLGNYLGALRNWVADQHDKDVFHGIVDLHALTVTEEPGVVGEATLNLAAMLFAIGLDPDVATVFVQSHVPEHPQLGWLMECTVSYGELSRMTQFKDKTAKREGQFISAGLFTYPALQAADILLYDTNEVPVGDDQRQHIELMRDIALRFNARFAPEDEPVLVVPEHRIPEVGARIMDLQEPTRKMSTTGGSVEGTVYVLDEPAAIEKKFKRAVTDSDNEIRFDRTEKPGVSNLLELLAVARGTSIDEAVTSMADARGYGDLKAATAAAVVELLAPVQERYAEIRPDEAALEAALAAGAAKARAIASETLVDVRAAMGVGPVT